MQAITVQFEQTSVDYKPLLKVLKRSWEAHHKIPLKIIQTGPLDRTAYPRNWWVGANTHKLAIWRENIDQDTILLDCDMLCMNDMTVGFTMIDHIGYTLRENDKKFILNGGVVFVKYTDYALQFMDKWVEINNKMVYDQQFHSQYRRKYHGMNQASLGWMIENGWKATPMPELYNLCRPWKDWQNAKMIHVKSQLRKAVMAQMNPSKPRRTRGRALLTPSSRRLKGLINHWMKYA